MPKWRLIEYWDSCQMYEVACWVDDEVDDWNYQSLYTDNKIEAEEYLDKKIEEL